MKVLAGLALLTALVTPSVASAGWADGDWCATDGERLVIDGDGLGFNEHTICEWSDGAPQGNALDATALCANLHADGAGGWVRMGEKMARLQADRGVADVITVTVENGEPVDFSRCDG